MTEPTGTAKRAASAILSDLGMLGKTTIRKYAIIVDAALADVVATERLRCLKIAEEEACPHRWKCDCGHAHAEDIEERIRSGK